jgi:hypothetical protein
MASWRSTVPFPFASPGSAILTTRQVPTSTVQVSSLIDSVNANLWEEAIGKAGSYACAQAMRPALIDTWDICLKP